MFTLHHEGVWRGIAIFYAAACAGDGYAIGLATTALVGVFAGLAMALVGVYAIPPWEASWQREQSS